MIAATIVQEIRGLLVEGRLSQRKIARSLGVSRGTVNAIALGRRPDPAARDGEPADEPDGFVPPRGRFVRCRGCGGMVQMPCLVCRIRVMQQENRKRPASGE